MFHQPFTFTVCGKHRFDSFFVCVAVTLSVSQTALCGYMNPTITLPTRTMDLRTATPPQPPTPVLVVCTCYFYYFCSYDYYTTTTITTTATHHYCITTSSTTPPPLLPLLRNSIAFITKDLLGSQSVWFLPRHSFRCYLFNESNR